jgi:cytochrome P460
MNVKLWALMGAAVVTTPGLASSPTADDFTADGQLRRPADVREYVYLSSGVGMAYGPARQLAASGEPPFTNVYVKPAAYREFMKTGVWPEGSVFFLEVRGGVTHASIDRQGRSQGPLLAIEALVKDTTRYPQDGWAFFDLGVDRKSAAPMPRTASCYACHSKHAAVEWSFTQFYPEQFAVAQQKGTVRKDYDPNLKAE